METEGKKILRIDVPPARREDKPVYIGPDPMKGTYRRDYEGDYLCSPDEVRGMFADSQDAPRDLRVVDSMSLEALSRATVKDYRQVFSQLHSTHPWTRLRDDEFLIRLRAAAKNEDGGLSPTVAGLLMFGESFNILQEFPDYFLDYREESPMPEVRWLCRICSNDGDWSGNIFDFYFRIINRIDDEVAVPFSRRRNGFRVSETNVHLALGEAVANALIHSDYKERRGVVIVKDKKSISISNPGTLRVTKEELLAGGNSDPRNPTLQRMFSLINIGERAGSGVEKIFSAWKEQGWKEPEYSITNNPGRVSLYLETGQIVYIPGLADLRQGSGHESKEELVLAYVKEHGAITMSETAELCQYKSRTAARRLIDKLIEDGRLKRTGQGNQVRYVLNDLD